MSYDLLFSKSTLGNREVQNRFLAQPMEANDADEGGKVSRRTIDRYVQLAKGKWGIIVVEAVSVTNKSLARCNGLIINDENLDGFKELVNRVKSENPNVIFLIQITHSGRNSNAAFSEKVSICPDAPDDMRVLTKDEIQEITDWFKRGILLAEQAGFDGVDFKLCHGYFGSEMFRPANDRQDKWGGSFENRCNFIREVVTEVKQKLVNPDFILGSRISMYEGIRGGCGTSGKNEIVEDLSERFMLLKVMDELGLDYVNVSAGIPGITSEITRPVKSAKLMYLNHLRYDKAAKEYLKSIGSNIKVIGSAYSILKEEGLPVAEEMIAKNYIDFAGWGRQIFADPLMPEKLLERKKVDWCVACSGCSKLMLAQQNDGCIIFNDYYKKLWKDLNSKKKK